MSTRKVSYFHHQTIGDYMFLFINEDSSRKIAEQRVIMEPHRVAMTHCLNLAYGLYKKMDVYETYPATAEDMKRFHTSDYIDFMQRVAPEEMIPERSRDYVEKVEKYFSGGDNPEFEDVLKFCQVSCGGSLQAARCLMANKSDIAINWAGGLHHGTTNKASGFCYTNDIVIAILELLQMYPRVFYIDIDVHHGDGVEKAFTHTNRVMTLSLHQYGNSFFPGTGSVNEKGTGEGLNYAVNVPLGTGMKDDQYADLFGTIIDAVFSRYDPSVVVLQCGADSLSGDPLGGFNLTPRGHGKCVQMIKKRDVPLLVLGGGGYNIENVAKCWTYETSVLLDLDIDDNLPFNEYWDRFGPSYKLHPVKAGNRPNQNNVRNLQKTREKVLQNLAQITAVPSVQFMDVPRQTTRNNEDGNRSRVALQEARGEYFD